MQELDASILVAFFLGIFLGYLVWGGKSVD